MTKEYTMASCLAEYLTLKAERAEWEAEWRDISDYLLPGRGIYSTLSTPQKRKLTSPKTINTVGRDALRVLTSGVQGGLIPSSRPWLELAWKDKSLNKIGFFKDWIYEAQQVLATDFQDTNFYPTNSSAITEVAGFGTMAVFVDSDAGDKPFQFILLTAGEYVFSVDYLGRPDKFYRMVFMTPRNLIERFGKGRVSLSTRQIVENNSSIQDKKFIAVLECVLPIKYQDKPIKRMFWEVGSAGVGEAAMVQYANTNSAIQGPLQVSGFYEFPVAIGRWETIGQDQYGLGPGSEALPEIKRLQEMEKASRMAVHKDVDPPLSAPSYMKGKLVSLPGSKNYYRNPQDKISPLYARAFNYQGIDNKIERVEMGIKLKFFNDIFLTASRDPNASPMKAAEVQVKEGEKLLRLGSVVERLIPEFFNPMITRCFNINLRNGRFPEIPDEYKDMISPFSITFTSPLAQAQKLIASKSIEQTLAFVGQAASMLPEVMDKIDTDVAIDEYADAHGTTRRIFNSEEKVAKIRQDRAKAQQAQQQKAEKMQEAEMGAKTGPAEAGMAKTRAETGQIMTEALVDQQGLGGLV